jgi:hypothetical protein
MRKRRKIAAPNRQVGGQVLTRGQATSDTDATTPDADPGAYIRHGFFFCPSPCHLLLKPVGLTAPHLWRCGGGHEHVVHSSEARP